jgi:hypothetical protein
LLVPLFIVTEFNIVANASASIELPPSRIVNDQTLIASEVVVIDELV